jgi:hypothetical protein
MRAGLIISVIGHAAALIVGLLFAGANPFASVSAEAITVDIVSPNEIANIPDFAPERPDAMPSFEDSRPSAQASVPQPPSPSQPSSSQPPALAQQPAATTKPQPASPQRNVRQAAATPPAAPISPPSPPQFAPQPAEPEQPNLTGMFGLPLALPDGRLGGGFDAPAIDSAKIASTDISAFRDHLKTCSALPAAISATDKVRIVLRLSFKRDGTLASAPLLIEASASEKGPILMESAIKALRRCQPYTMLPADKYNEWKAIDLSFTPLDLGGG